jgi:hypothetical protein
MIDPIADLGEKVLVIDRVLAASRSLAGKSTPVHQPVYPGFHAALPGFGMRLCDLIFNDLLRWLLRVAAGESGTSRARNAPDGLAYPVKTPSIPCASRTVGAKHPSTVEVAT